MKKVVLAIALGAFICGTYSCSNANGAEAKVEESAGGMDQDAKTMADLSCKAFEMMMSGEAANPDGTPTAAFDKISNEVTALQGEMEKKYTKESGEWEKFEKMTQDLIDKCGK